MSNKRLREIIGAFSSVGLTTLKEKGKPIEDKSTPRKLRLAFEKLGPSFVKIGQILSTRSDLFPEAYIRELSKLQSDVLPLPQEVVMEAIAAELPVPFRKFLQAFLQSLWQVARLLRHIELLCLMAKKLLSRFSDRICQKLSKKI